MYVSGFLIPVPKNKKEEYRALAEKTAAFFQEYGATEIFENWEVNVPDGKVTDFRKAVQAGVKMAYGTDAGVYPHGMNGKQFAKMVEWGMTPMQAIQAATVNAADLLGTPGKVGVLKPGAYADLIAVKGDPLKDVSELERVQVVIKGGVVVKKDPSTPTT